MRAYRPERKTADLSTTGRDDRALGAAFYARFWRRVRYHALAAFVIRTGGVMGLRSTRGDEKRLLS